MSSSNQVRVTVIEETTYGETPAVGNFDTARITSESLSGSPETTESQLIRQDRLSSGQVVTGLTLSGDISTELAKDDLNDLFIESAMYSSWDTSSTPVAADLDIEATNKTLDRAAGDFNTDVVVGDLITLAGFTGPTNNTQVMVAEIVSATQIKYIGPSDMVTESSTGNTYELADKIEIGVTKKSFSIEKAFLDLTDKAINYRGMIADNMALNIAYGEIIGSTFSFVGNGYESVDVAADFMTDGRTINPAATTNPMNGSVDMSFLGNGASGTFTDTDFCIQSVEFGVANNNRPQNCIGRVAPLDNTEGNAGVEVTISAYLSNENWNMLKKKLDQTPFELGFMVKNANGYYGFYLPAVQITGDDPASTGINTDVILTLTGVAKVGASGEKSLRMFKG